jgi:hypothetical protein
MHHAEKKDQPKKYTETRDERVDPNECNMVVLIPFLNFLLLCWFLQSPNP